MTDEKIIEVEETKDEMNVVVVSKEGVFTRVGKFLDRNKKKIAIGAAATAATISMIIFVGRNGKKLDDGDPILDDDGFITVDPDDVVVETIES